MSHATIEAARFLLRHYWPASIFIQKGRKDDLHELAFRAPMHFSPDSLGDNGPASRDTRVVRTRGRVIRTRRLRLSAATRPWGRERDSHAQESMWTCQEEGREGQGEASSRPWQGAQESVAFSAGRDLQGWGRTGASIARRADVRLRCRQRITLVQRQTKSHRPGFLRQLFVRPCLCPSAGSSRRCDVPVIHQPIEHGRR